MKTPQLHGHFGTIVGYNEEKQYRYVYFIRKTTDGIPCPDMWDEAYAEMPLHFFVGNVSSDALATLILMLRSVSMWFCFTFSFIKSIDKVL